jgi:hypothetical protein
MSEQRDELSGDVERLAEWLYERERAKFYPGRVSFDEATWREPQGTSLGARNTCLSLAADILASDWLAAHDAEVAARVVAGVRAWCAINEIADPPLDWEGLGEFLDRADRVESHILKEQ